MAPDGKKASLRSSTRRSYTGEAPPETKRGLSEAMRKSMKALTNAVKGPEDWRHLNVVVGGELPEGTYCDNSITTSKYNVFTFVPKSLFEQFRRTANQFFLVMGILMFIGTYFQSVFISPIPPFTTLGPLFVILMITSAKEGYEDMFRHRSDAKVNSSPAIVLTKGGPAGATETIPWRDLRPGHVVVVKDREEIPADLVLLWSSEGVQAYVETANIDGETNLKIKKPASDDEGRPFVPSVAGAHETKFDLEFEPPNGKVHTFEGTFRPAGAAEAPLDANSFLLRGSVLRNTGEVLGVVAYTGKDTRLVRNSRAAPSKLSELERVVNNIIYFILGSMVTLTTVSLIAYLVFIGGNRKNFWYICERTNRKRVPSLFTNECDVKNFPPPGSLWPTFFILYTNFVPLSLYVTIEICNLVQSFYINFDLEMYDDISDTPALARTSNMNADLGMIAHVFSDKTGTLTQNVMTFRMCAAGGVSYGGPDHPLSEMRAEIASTDCAARDLATIMGVCHTVVPEKNEQGEVEYRAESPDEEALVDGAAQLGLAFATRDPAGITLDAFDGERRYAVLAVLPFDSARKRMSTLVRTPDGVARLMCKGADNIVLGLAKEGDEGCAKAGGRDVLQKALADFATEGLRTLVLAQRDLTDDECAAFQKRWRAAETAAGKGVDRAKLLAEAAATVERDLEVVGATAIEDKLQDGAPDTIAELAKAGIKLWVLTGDKVETAVNIGYSTKLLTPDMYLVRVPAEGAVAGDLGDYGVTAQLEGLVDVVAKAATLESGEVGSSSSSLGNAAANSDHLALVLEGATALEAILGDDRREQLLIQLASSCKAVLACRVSPAQKRLIVGLMRRKSPDKPITLAIGDGANDVGMIQEAHVGVGISGKEGRQAVNNADFAIAQFRFLKLLCLKHGRINYRRFAKLIIYSFFKNIALVFVLFWYNNDNGWSGASLYNPWVYSGYNFFLGLLPFCMGFFDVDTSSETLLKYPRLYAAGLHRMDLNVANMAYNTVEAVAASVVCYYVPRAFYEDSGGIWNHNGEASDVWVYGTLVFTGLVQAMMVRAAVLVDIWNPATQFCAVFQVLMLYSFILFMAQTDAGVTKEEPTFVDYSYFGVAYKTYSSLLFWLATLLLVPAIVTALQLLMQFVHLEYFADINDIGREIDHGYLDGEQAMGKGPVFSRCSLNSFMKDALGCRRPDAESQVSKASLAETFGSRQESQRLGVVDSESHTGHNYDHASGESFFTPATAPAAAEHA